jgi:hypothetical protein
MMKMINAVPPGVIEYVVGRNPPTSNDRQHEEPGGSRDCWWAPVPRSTARNPAHVLASESLGVPPDLVPDQESAHQVIPSLGCKEPIVLSTGSDL